MSWKAEIMEYRQFLRIEKGLSENTLSGYLHDVERYGGTMAGKFRLESATTVQSSHIREFLHILSSEFRLNSSSLSRNISAIKSFHGFLHAEEIARHNPSEMIEVPKQKRKLPVVLSIEEIDRMFAAIDHSTGTGTRNRAMLELLYSSGLRVSELVNLEMNRIFREEGFVKVTGKGFKERMVPLGGSAISQINIYLDHYRRQLKAGKGEEDILFLNSRGRRLSRNMVFMIVRDLAIVAGIEKTIGPHTFRHSFATHLVEGGADLKAVQDMLGHESITTTEIYLHMDREYLREVHRTFHPRG